MTKIALCELIMANASCCCKAWTKHARWSYAVRTHPMKIRGESVQIQGDTSGCAKPLVDIDVKVALKYKDLILKCDFQINVNRRFCTT